MMITLSEADFQCLSPAAQVEILALLTGGTGGLDIPSRSLVREMCPLDDVPAQAYEETQSSDETSGKRVIGITAEQATELVANISERSQETLRLFAVAERVGVGQLVGPDSPYRDMTDLKRSFVGAVNRRLRTVVGNRAVVLFASDRDRQRVRIMPMAAAALRQAFGIGDWESGEAFDDLDVPDDNAND